MTHYECCYSSGRQHIFVESRRRWLLMGTAAALAASGLLLGVGIGLTVSVGGLFIFELLSLIAACASAYQAYLSMFRRASSSVDVSSYIIGNLTFAGLFCLVVGAVRYSWQLGLDGASITALLGFGGVVFGVVLYGYVCLCLQEDERKHHLGVCSSDGSPFSREPGAGGTPPRAPTDLQELRKFFVWIGTGQWVRDSWTECQTPLAEEEGVSPSETIIIHNKTLKLIKVCLYADDDLICWVPFGGISGRFVGFIHAEQSRAFDLRGEGFRRRHFHVKVFQPGIFDKELASFPKARCGQSFSFADVEGMVKRSRTLSSSLAVVAAAPSLPRRDSLSFATDSEDEPATPLPLRTSPPRAAEAAAAPPGASSSVAPGRFALNRWHAVPSGDARGESRSSEMGCGGVVASSAHAETSKPTMPPPAITALGPGSTMTPGGFSAAGAGAAAAGGCGGGGTCFLRRTSSHDELATGLPLCALGSVSVAASGGGQGGPGHGHGGGLRRAQGAQALLGGHLHAAAEDSPAGGGGSPASGPLAAAAGGPSPQQARRAGTNEVVIRNRSDQEVKALLFNGNDFCFLVPLAGEVVLPHQEVRFDPQKSPSREFTLKVYSVGPGSKELTYLTVSRGSAYMFCDSLLS